MEQLGLILHLSLQGCSKDGEQSKRSDDEDEDIIDLGKDEDLDFEIKNDGNSEPKVRLLLFSNRLECEL